MAANPFLSVATRRRPPIFSGLLALALCSVPALAADFPEPYGSPREFSRERLPPPPVEDYRPGREPSRLAEPCRTVIRRRITPEGEEIIKRVTICEEHPDRFRPEREPEGGYGEPRPYRRPPIPPREVPFADEARPDQGGYVGGEPPAEGLAGEERLSEEPPLEGRGRDPRY
ncbi:hypothetical protein [Methylobacterium sp. CM6247]